MPSDFFTTIDIRLAGKRYSKDLVGYGLSRRNSYHREKGKVFSSQVPSSGVDFKPNEFEIHKYKT